MTGPAARPTHETSGPWSPPTSTTPNSRPWPTSYETLPRAGWRLLAHDRVFALAEGGVLRVLPWPSAAAFGFGLLDVLDLYDTVRTRLASGERMHPTHHPSVTDALLAGRREPLRKSSRQELKAATLARPAHRVAVHPFSSPPTAARSASSTPRSPRAPNPASPQQTGARPYPLTRPWEVRATTSSSAGRRAWARRPEARQYATCERQQADGAVEAAAPFDGGRRRSMSLS